jgi:phytoene synthase
MSDHVGVSNPIKLAAAAPAAVATPPEGGVTITSDKSTFAPGLRLLPADIRADVHSLYCVLRALDDLVDEDDPRAQRRVQAVECWVRGQHADTPETRALGELARRHPLPRDALFAFCEGMRHDIARARVEDDEDFARYCQQAGGSVGVVLANLLGAVDGEAGGKDKVERGMATLGRAMQVTNILRDIDEDLTRGRLYIARTAIERFGFPLPGAREALLRDHIARADALYEDGLGAIALLLDGRRAMAVSTALYREILRQIERDGFGRRPGRVVVPAWRRNMLVAKHRLNGERRAHEL